MYSLNKTLAYLLIDSATGHYDKTSDVFTHIEASDAEIADTIKFLQSIPDYKDLKVTIFKYISRLRKSYKQSSTFINHHPEYSI